MNTSPSEVMTVEEFARKLHVSRATVFAWIKRGTLAEGIHYFKIGRVLRFIWSEELLEMLLSTSSEGEKTARLSPSSCQPVKAKPINWDY